MQSGVLALDKPAGPSSTQVVEQVKRILDAKKVGHLGTLDPFATGLLPMGVNEGTKIAAFLLDAQKTYAGVVGLGVETDTQDKTGKVISVRVVPDFGEKELARLRAAFVGVLQQTPPMYSALKKNGVRLYELARRGESVPRAKREIKVERLELRKLSEAEIGFELVCSKGTYVRTLAADMGAFLGCGAHLKSLRRLSCGPLTLERAISLAELEERTKRGSVPLISLSEALSHLPRIRGRSDWLPRLRMGQQDVLAALQRPEGDKNMARLVDEDGVLIALIEWGEGESQAGGWRINRVFAGYGKFLAGLDGTG
jgi:tRNA pseudouridine55 synthase